MTNRRQRDDDEGEADVEAVEFVGLGEIGEAVAGPGVKGSEDRVAERHDEEEDDDQESRGDERQADCGA